MEFSDKAVEFVKKFEGCVLHAYWDVDAYSIGWGTHGSWIKKGMTCTQEQADAWLLAKMHEVALSVEHLVKVPLNQNEFDALVDFCYNLGSGALAASHLLIYLNADKHDLASQEFVKWDHVGYVENADLKKRRLAERDLFCLPI